MPADWSRMMFWIAILALAANGAAAPPQVPKAKAAASRECRDERGRFRLHCFPKGTVKPMPRETAGIPSGANPAKERPRSNERQRAARSPES